MKNKLKKKIFNRILEKNISKKQMLNKLQGKRDKQYFVCDKCGIRDPCILEFEVGDIPSSCPYNSSEFKYKAKWKLYEGEEK